MTKSRLPWMDLAWAEADRGVKEIPGPEHNPRIVAYHQATGLKARDDETPWCGSFVAWVMKMCKIPYKFSTAAAARSWLDFGEKLEAPIPGCLVIFRRGAGGHVGFVVADDGERLHVLGGNQSNTVRVSSYRKTDLLGYRWPTGYSKPGPKPLLKSRTAGAAATTTVATVIGSLNALSDASSTVSTAAGNVTAAANGILGVPVWVWPLIAMIAGCAILFLLWQDRRRKTTT